VSVFIASWAFAPGITVLTSNADPKSRQRTAACSDASIPANRRDRTEQFDEELMRQYQRGNEEAFRCLYERHRYLSTALCQAIVP
jgi:hypothetical protein